MSEGVPVELVKRVVEHPEANEVFLALQDLPEEARKLVLAAAFYMLDSKQGLGHWLFNAVAKKLVTPCIELIIVRRNAEGSIEVLLRSRDDDDPAYPGMKHCPGRVHRPGEDDEGAITRLLETEVPEARIAKRLSVGHNHVLDEARGHFLQHIYAVRLEDSGVTLGSKLEWHNYSDVVSGLVPNVVKQHEEVLLPLANLKALALFMEW